MTNWLFSYGTLQLEAVQLEKFGRRLEGVPDRLEGWRPVPIEIDDEETVRLSGSRVHPILRRSDSPTDCVDGVRFELDEAELAAADAYEAEEYGRIAVDLASGVRSYVYVSRDEAATE